MFHCQNSLILHIRNGFDTATLPTLKEYAGEFRDGDDSEAWKLTELLDACFIVYTDGTPSAQEAFNQYDLYVVTENRTLDKEESKNDNLKLSPNILEYLRTKAIFNRQGAPGTYYIDNEKTTARTLAITPRFTVIAISLFIDDNTKEVQ